MAEPLLEARLDKNRVVNTYRALASTYDLWGKVTESDARDRCLDLAAVHDGEAVLEVAVGTGLTFAGLLQRNPHGRTEGIDLTDAMLERAKARAAGIAEPGAYNLTVGDAYQLPFEAANFDLVVNNYMFDLLPEADFATVLAEFHRVLRPGGRLVLVNMTKPEHWYQGWAEAIYRVRASWMGGCRGVLTEPTVRAAGFSDVSREFISQAGFPSEIIAARKAVPD